MRQHKGKWHGSFLVLTRVWGGCSWAWGRGVGVVGWAEWRWGFGGWRSGGPGPFPRTSADSGWGGRGGLGHRSELWPGDERSLTSVASTGPSLAPVSRHWPIVAVTRGCTKRKSPTSVVIKQMASGSWVPNFSSFDPCNYVPFWTRKDISQYIFFIQSWISFKYISWNCC